MIDTHKKQQKYVDYKSLESAQCVTMSSITVTNNQKARMRDTKAILNLKN